MQLRLLLFNLEFIRETGGQMYYTGCDMALAHQGMGITETDWSRFIEIVTSVVGELGVGPTEDGEVMDFLNSLKTDISYFVDLKQDTHVLRLNRYGCPVFLGKRQRILFWW